MRDWIVGLSKAAIEQRPGADSKAWRVAEYATGGGAPDELRELYQQFNGATFASGVVLYELTTQGDSRGLLHQSTSGGAGLPKEDTWRFGRKDTEHLAAVRKRRLGELDQRDPAPLPAWLEELSDDDWVFVARDENTHAVRFYRTLEELLKVRIPPAEAEEFGEQTLAHARSLVEAAVTELGAATSRGLERLIELTTGKRRKGGVKKGARKSAARKATAKGARKSAAKKATAKGARKSAAKKATAKGARKSAAKKATAKGARKTAGKNARKGTARKSGAGQKKGARKSARR